jgi:hypothetical protein
MYPEHAWHLGSYMLQRARVHRDHSDASLFAEMATRSVWQVLQYLYARETAGLSADSIQLIDCSTLRGSAKGRLGGTRHSGFHARDVVECLSLDMDDQRELRPVLRRFLAARRATSGPVIFAFHCATGERESPCASYAMSAYAMHTWNCHVQRLDLCKGRELQPGCGGCHDCDPAMRTEARLALKERIASVVQDEQSKATWRLKSALSACG